MRELTSNQRDALRYLLAAVVLADGRIFESELAAYAVKLRGLIGEESDPAEESRWLLDHALEVKTHMSGPGGRAWLGRQVLVLHSSGRIGELLDALWSVAVSDRDLHPAESDIIDLAFSLWPSASAA